MTVTQKINSSWQLNKEAFGLSKVQPFFSRSRPFWVMCRFSFQTFLLLAIKQFVPFIYSICENKYCLIYYLHIYTVSYPMLLHILLSFYLSQWIKNMLSIFEPFIILTTFIWTPLILQICQTKFFLTYFITMFRSHFSHSTLRLSDVFK